MGIGRAGARVALGGALPDDQLGHPDKVLVVGIDGGTFTILEPLIESGRLPTLGSMVREGARGVLKSTIPPQSAPAWTSLATGKNPGKHGVFQFSRIDRSVYQSGFRRVVNANSIVGSTLWELLSDAGKSVGVMNVPMTYPARAVNGYMITGMLTPRDSTSFTYPPELADELQDYHIDLAVGNDVYGRMAGRDLGTTQARKNLVDELKVSLHARADTAVRLMRERPSDFFMIVFTETDRLQHYLWDCLDPKTDFYRSREAGFLREEAERLLVELDAEIGRLFRQAGDGAVKMVVSDHGFRSYPDKTVYMNLWLAEQGLLKMHAAGSAGGKLRYWLKKLRISRETIFFVANRLIPSALMRNIAAGIHGGQYPIDWEKSTAVYVPILNCVGGIELLLGEDVDLGDPATRREYEACREDIMQRLVALRDPATGEPIAASVFRREEVYAGPRSGDAPDIIIAFDPDYRGERSLLASSVVSHTRIQDSHWTGAHAMEGILMLSGCNVMRTNLETRDICDIAPTVLHLLGVAVPSDMDGGVITSALDARFLAKHPVRVCEVTTPAEDRPETADSAWASEEEMAEIQDHLRGLGYL